MSTLLEQKCPCCGGAVEFDVGVQKLKCPFCDTEFDITAMQGISFYYRHQVFLTDLYRDNVCSA